MIIIIFQVTDARFAEELLNPPFPRYILALEDNVEMLLRQSRLTEHLPTAFGISRGSDCGRKRSNQAHPTFCRASCVYNLVQLRYEAQECLGEDLAHIHRVVMGFRKPSINASIENDG